MEELNESRVYLDPHSLFSTWDKINILKTYSRPEWTDWDMNFISGVSKSKFITEKVQSQVDIMFKKYVGLRLIDGTIEISYEIPFFQD